MSTYFALLAEFNAADVPLEQVAAKYFGLDRRAAIRAATQNQLPVPAFRAPSRKAPWLVNIADLARWIDTQREKARNSWERDHAVN